MLLTVPGGAGGWSGEDFSTTHGLDITTANKKILGKIWDVIRYNGFTALQTAGIMGNICGESDFQSNQVETTGIGYGLIQWSYGRRTQYEAYADSLHKSHADIPTQIAFLTREYKSGYKTRLDGHGWSAVKTSKETCVIWCGVFEIGDYSQISHYADSFRLYTKRVPAAQTLYTWFKDAVVPANVPLYRLKGYWTTPNAHEVQDMALSLGFKPGVNMFTVPADDKIHTAFVCQARYLTIVKLENWIKGRNVNHSLDYSLKKVVTGMPTMPTEAGTLARYGVL